MKPTVFALTALLAASACAPLPYQPAWTETSPRAFDAAAFEAAVATVRVDYPRLAVVDQDAFRLQSAWVPHQRDTAVGERRATVYREGDRLAVVVEARYLRETLLGSPQWGPAAGDPTLERALVERLDRVLRAP